MSWTTNLLWPVFTGGALAAIGLAGRIGGIVSSPHVDRAALSQSAPRLPVPQAPASTAAPSAVPAVAPASASRPPASFQVQVASFEVKETAEALARELAGRGLSAHSEAYGGPQAGWWHVVRIGPLPSRVEAERLRLNLPAPESLAAFVLPRANGTYHLQVASLRSAPKAEALAARLRRRGHQARVTEAQGWHCVRVGPFDSRDEAEGYQTLFAAREGIESRVIPFVPRGSGA